MSSTTDSKEALTGSSTDTSGVNTPDTDQSKQNETNTPEGGDKTEKTEKSGDAEKTEEAEKIIIGMVADTKDVFAKIDADGNRSWSDKPPSDLEEAPENETTQKYAIIVRKSQSHKIIRICGKKHPLT